jgi:hypothetical protein
MSSFCWVTNTIQVHISDQMCKVLVSDLEFQVSKVGDKVAGRHEIKVHFQNFA